MTLRRCSYAYSLVDKEPLAPSEPSDEGVDEEEIWQCPHEVVEQSEYCLFHAPVQKKDPDRVATAVEELLAGDVDAPPELIGARFAELNLSGTVLDHGATPVDLRAVTVENDIEFRYTEVRSPVRLADALVGGRLNLDSATFEADLDISRTRIKDSISAEGADFATVSAPEIMTAGEIQLDQVSVSGRFRLSQTSIQGLLSVQNATFDGQLALTEIDFGDVANFRGTTFGDRVNLRRSAFQEECVFRDVRFEQSLTLDETSFGAAVHFDRATFARRVAIPAAMFDAEVRFVGARFDEGLRLAESRFNAPVTFDEAVFDGIFDAEAAVFEDIVQFAGVNFDAPAMFDETVFQAGVAFGDANFAADASFDGTTFATGVGFATATFRGDLYFAPTPIDRADHRVFDLEGVELQSGELVSTGPDVTINLTNATLGDVSLTAAGSDGSLERFRLVNVRFDDFDFSKKEFRDQLAGNGWRLHTTVQDDTSQSMGRRLYEATLGRALMTAPPVAEVPGVTNRDLETTYLRAKNGADEDGYTTGAAEFFIKEKVYRRRTYLDRTGPRSGRLGAVVNYLANLSLAVTTGYGERPFRPVAASFFMVFLYAAVYVLLFDPPLLADANVWEHVLFSGQNFVAFVVGPPPEQSGSLLFRLATALEAFTGAFFVALFVFSLTRSIDR